MCSTKKFIGILFLLVIPVFSFSQTVVVKKEKSRINGEQLEGFEVILEGKAEDVRAAYIKFLKPIGKTKQTSDNITINEPSLNGIGYTKPFFALIKENGSTTTAWIGINPAGWDETESKQVNNELEKLMKEFGVKFYRDKIQVQVDESLRAQQAVEKQQQRLVNENKLLTTKLEDNKREKIQLEKSIENNKLEYEELLKKIENNKHAQDSVTLVGEQVKKVVEANKEKQRKVN